MRKTRLMLAAALLTTAIAPAKAQDAPSATAAAAILAPAPAPHPSWLKIGGPFGRAQAWQFGLDKSATFGACYEYDVTDKENLIGYCRDALILARSGVPAMHLGAGVLYDVQDISHSRPAYRVRLGLDVGPALHDGLTRISEKIPYLEGLGNFTAPKPLRYLGSITTVDASGGPRIHPLPTEKKWGWGVSAKVDIPLGDLADLIVGAGGK